MALVPRIVFLGQSYQLGSSRPCPGKWCCLLILAPHGQAMGRTLRPSSLSLSLALSNPFPAPLKMKKCSYFAFSWTSNNTASNDSLCLRDENIHCGGRCFHIGLSAIFKWSGRTLRVSFSSTTRPVREQFRTRSYPFFFWQNWGYRCLKNEETDVAIWVFKRAESW